MDALQKRHEHGTVEYQLAENQPLRMSDAMGGIIQCLSGTAWVTVAGEYTDFMLRAGMDFEIPNNGLTLIEAVGRGQVRISFPVNTPWYRTLAGLHS